MNKWIRRTAGTVGIAGGALLLGTAAAHAADSAAPLADPQALQDLAGNAQLGDGISGFGVSVDTPGQRDTVGLLPDGGGPVRTGTNNGELGATLHAPTGTGQPRDVFANTGRTPDLFQSLPITDVVPMDGLGLPTGGTGGLGGRPSPGPQYRTLPAPAEAGQTGIPVRNLPLGTSTAGDGLSRDGLAGNGLGVPMGDRLPVGAVQGLASQGQALGGRTLGGLPLGGGLGGGGLGGGTLGGGGLGGLTGGQSAQGQSAQGQSAQGQSAQGQPAAGGQSQYLHQDPRSAQNQQYQAQPAGGQSLLDGAGDAVSVLPVSSAGESWTEAAELPSADQLPVLGNMLSGGSLPTRANVNTLPGAPTLPVHDLIAPGTSAAGGSTGTALNNASGAVNNASGAVNNVAAGDALGGLGQAAQASQNQNARMGESLTDGGLTTDALGGPANLPVSADSLPTDSLTGDAGLPVVGGLTGGGSQGLPLPSTGLPVVGGLADGVTGMNQVRGAAGGGAADARPGAFDEERVGKHRAYVGRHAR